MGTVYSGHPTATTLFNTIRVLSYIAFAAHLVGVEGVLLGLNELIKAYVSGDDVIIVSKL